MILDKLSIDDTDIYLIDTYALGNPKAVACYLIVDDSIALVDMGYPSSHNTIINDLISIGITPRDIDYLIPTHLHLDHCGSLGYLAIYNDAKIILHARAKKHILDPTRLVSSVKEVFGSDVLERFGYPKPVDAKKSIIEVTAGNSCTVNLGNVELTCISAEGHAPHQIAVHINASMPCIITADAVSMLYPEFPYLMIPTTPPPSFDHVKYVDTVKRLESFDARVLLMPHFGISYEPQRIFYATLDSISEWVSMISSNEDIKSVESVENSMIEYVASKANVSIDSMPEYVKSSIRNSTKGIYAYLNGVMHRS
jgi:glyoxylase-like metal-dependent hydrolase (beta-lactamase superfamily II)